METFNPHRDSFENNSSIPKQNNFKIPEGYFDELASRLEDQLEINKDSDKPKNGVLRVLMINISIAAAVVLGVFLFNPEKGTKLSDQISKMEVEDPEAIYVEDYLISMVSDTEEWQPLEYYEIELLSVSEEEVLEIEMPVVDEVTSGDLTDFFEEEDYDDYEL